MNGILMPEIIIFNTLESIVKLLRADLTDNALTESESILYRLLGVDEEGKQIKMNLYDYFKQAKKMFSKPDSLTVNFGYNQKVAQAISMHIIMPSEQGKASIGSDEGYIEKDVIVEDVKVGTQLFFTQMYDCVYQIMITSNNSQEVNVIYNVLKSMLLMLTPHLELMGLRIPVLSGNDILMQDELIPVPLFHKVINLSFTYEHNVPQLVQMDIAKRFYIIMKAIDYNDKTS